MIGIKLQGRLGNQMFQYAFAYVVSKKRNEDFFISKYSSKFLLGYFSLNGNNFNKFYNTLKRLLFHFNIIIKSKTLYQTGSENTEDVLKEAEQCNQFDGYFQSELYLRGFENDVRKLFELKQEHKLAFEKKYNELFRSNKIIAVHVRRTDYLTWDRGDTYGTDSALPFNYVENFLKKFDLKEYKVLFISDDIAAVKGYFGQNSNFYFESNSTIIDFQILLNADVLCLSNSSFSWWGAYLNRKSDKQVFAPECWLGFITGSEFPKDIICKNWQQLNTGT